MLLPFINGVVPYFHNGACTYQELGFLLLEDQKAGAILNNSCSEEVFVFSWYHFVRQQISWRIIVHRRSEVWSSLRIPIRTDGMILKFLEQTASDSSPFNLHPEKLFGGYSVKCTLLFSGRQKHLIFFRAWRPFFYLMKQKKIGCHALKNLRCFCHPEKIG